MGTTYYTARKSLGYGRQSFAVTFRHPLRTDSRGKPGLKVRRGLGTTDEAEAERHVAELNTLLSDERYWSLAARPEAARQFSPVVVSAFYAGLEVATDTADQTRDGAIPLPGADQGYTRVMLVGTTGAGKTTLLRQLIGAHPQRDRFPSTSPGKTTVADLEVVTAPGAYHGVVTFFPERALRGYVQECVTAACLAAWSGSEDATVARRLLQHPDQKFRLQYVLGEWPSDAVDDEDWGFDEDESDETGSDAEETLEDVPTAAERAENAQRLAGWVQRIRDLVAFHGPEVAHVMEFEWSELSGDSLEAAEGNLTMELEDSDEHSEIVLEILELILARFERLDQRFLSKSTTGWPTKWEMKSDNRTEFLRSVRWFSSNYQPRYGRLLTPVVQGMRIQGPFYPELDEVQPKLVLIDGQGLGHTPESASSVSTNITSRYAEVDVIMLVDNATQPMQAAPLAVVRTVATGGFQEKLAIAFTHFDQVRGANVPTVAAKREHVVNAARNVLSTLRTEIGPTLVRSLEEGLDERCFMLGWLNQGLEALKPKMREQLMELLRFFERAITPREPIPAMPVYDPASVLFAVQAAARDFHARWAALLGFESMNGVTKAPWATVKALNRRIADRWAIEYRHLMPVADLFTRLSEEISKFLDSPLTWEGDASDPSERQRAVSNVRQAVSGVLHEFTTQRVIQEHMADWVRAYDRTGRGSTLDRARDIREIYEDAAPVPGVIMTEHTQQFLERVREMVYEAILAGGGKIAGRAEPEPAMAAPAD